MTADASTRDMQWACRLANRGYTVEQIYDAITAKPGPKRPAASMKYRRIIDKRGLDVADAYARRTAEKAVEFVTSNPQISDKGSAFVQIVGTQVAAASLPWATYGGAGARRALDAAFEVAYRVGGPRFGLALREWAELSGQTFEAIRTHRSTLVNTGWLVRNPNDRNGRTARFTMRTPSHIHSHQGGENVGLTLESHLRTHDAFGSAALGDDGWYLIHALAVQKSRRDLALITGYDPDVLLVHLGRLESMALVDVDDLHVRRAPYLLDALDACASAFGTTGDAQARRELHRAQREAFRRRGEVNVGGTR